LLSVGLSSGFELKHEATTRTLRADTLRDFPNECFAATQCKVYKQGESWPLTPFCGVSRCVPLKAGGLGEQITDCGRALDLEKTPGCKVIKESFDPKANFPDCCPVYECEEGTEPVYIQPPTAAPKE